MRASFYRIVVGVAAIVFAACSGSSQRQARPADASQDTVAAFLPDVTSQVMTLRVSHRAYQISVALPDGYAATHTPYPVLYAADANSEFWNCG
jgi:predicted alpha/beta superfamily hydrolase